MWGKGWIGHFGGVVVDFVAGVARPWWRLGVGVVAVVWYVFVLAMWLRCEPFLLEEVDVV